jgi:vesicle-fusing ATPase
MFGRYSGTSGRSDPPPPQNTGRQPPPQNYSRPGAPPASSYDQQNYGQAQPTYGAPQRTPVGRPPPEQAMASRGRAGPMQLRVAKTPGNDWALANNAAFSPQDFPGQQELYLMLNGQFVVTAHSAPQIQPGTIGLSDFQRRWAGIGLGPSSVVDVVPYDPFSQGAQGYLGGMDMELAFQNKNKRTEKPYDQEELQAIVNTNFANQILAPGQVLVFGSWCSFQCGRKTN